MMRPARSRTNDLIVPETVLSRRSHGSLDAITDSERRSLRPIGTTAHEVAAKTGGLLTDLLTHPGVWIFQGIHPAVAGSPRISHAVMAGHRLILVESVAWPPGRYVTCADDRILCDGIYIGQSAGPLISAARHWQGILRRGHQVSAFVVVHPASDGKLTLPATTSGHISWAHAGNAVRDIRACLPSQSRAVSVRAVAALVAATAEEEIW